MSNNNNNTSNRNANSAPPPPPPPRPLRGQHETFTRNNGGDNTTKK